MEEKKKQSFFRKLFKRKKLVILVILILVVGFLLLKNTLFPSKDGHEEAKIEKGTVREELILSGQVEATDHAFMSFLSSGELDYVGVTEGQEVEKGDVLAKLDTTVLYQTYLSAESDLRRYDASREKTYDDVQGHKDDETFAQKEDRTIAESNRDKAYRAYVAAQQNLSNATLRAPFNGLVASVSHPYTGINTSLTESQIEIVDPNTAYFEVSADQTEVTQLSLGQKVAIVLDSYSDDEYEGDISFIGLTPKAGEVGAVYLVKVKFSGDPINFNTVKIGMTGDAKFILSHKDDVLYVPSQYVKSDSKGKYLLLGKPNNKVYIETGIEGEESTEVKGNIKEGDTVYD